MQAIRTALGQYIYEAEEVDAEIGRLRAHVLELESHVVDMYNAQEPRSVLPGRLGHTDWCAHLGGAPCDCGAAQMSNWQPIETAPKDGTHILAVDASSKHGFGLYSGVRVPIQTVVHWWHHPGEEGWYTSVNELAPERTFNATHWKALEGFPNEAA